MMLAKFLPRKEDLLNEPISSPVSLYSEINLPEIESELMKLGFTILKNWPGDKMFLINCLDGLPIKFRPEYIEAVTLVNKGEETYTALTFFGDEVRKFAKVDKTFAWPLAKLWVITSKISLNFDLSIYKDEDFKELIDEIYGPFFLNQLKEIILELEQEVKAQRYESAALLKDKGNSLVYKDENKERFEAFISKLKKKLSLEFWNNYLVTP